MAMKPGERVAIVGCGPVGTVLALALYKNGIPVTILEQEPGTVKDQRAATLHLTTVEFLDDLGVFEDFIDLGMKAPLYQFGDRQTGKVVAEFDHGVLADEVRFPYAFQYEQYKLVDSIVAHIGDTPDVEYRFSCKVTGVEQTADAARVTFENQDGENESMDCVYVVACDGARSTVRDLAGIEFEGFTWPERFVKIATTFDFYAAERGYCTRNFLSDPDEWCNLFHVPGENGEKIWRTVFPVKTEETDEYILSEEGVQARLQRFFPKDGDYPIAYKGLYPVHQRVAKSFNAGRVLLAGDASHANNPIGGLGMNGGIHDAINLAGKLHAILNKGEDTALLDRYSRQRRKAQIDGVQAQSMANKKLMEAREPKERARQLDEIRHTAQDLELHKAYLRKSSMILGLQAAESVQ
ncbi:MAG: FAD-dependent monooxygenase [Rhodospirillales bacterium]|nr:FAD-dependent monooxygenase [Rhodospirillales bacterium]